MMAVLESLQQKFWVASGDLAREILYSTRDFALLFIQLAVYVLTSLFSSGRNPGVEIIWMPIFGLVSGMWTPENGWAEVKSSNTISTYRPAGTPTVSPRKQLIIDLILRT